MRTVQTSTKIHCRPKRNSHSLFLTKCHARHCKFTETHNTRHVCICSWLPCMHRRHPKPTMTSQLVYYWALDTSQIDTLIMEWFMAYVHICSLQSNALGPSYIQLLFLILFHELRAQIALQIYLKYGIKHRTHSFLLKLIWDYGIFAASICTILSEHMLVLMITHPGRVGCGG